MSKKKLLFITEGETDEPKFIDKVFKKCYPNIEYDYYSYSTTIHTLVKLIFDRNGKIDAYLDIQRVLKENEKVEYKRKILSQIYTDIILVFDFEPHYEKPEFEKILKMLYYFNDSTDNGKLYINYPMMQSYRHIMKYPEEDVEFKDRKVKSKDGASYKEIVNSESCIKNLNKYNFPLIMKIVGYQLKKANYILNNDYEIPTNENFYNINLSKIYEIQCNKNKAYGWIYVLNTFVFNIIEYNPKILLDRIREFA